MIPLYRRKVFLWVVLVLVMTNIGIFAYKHLATASLMTQRELRNISRLIAARQELLVEQTEQVLVLLSKLPQVRGNDATLCHQALSAILKNEKRYVNFGVIDPQGNVWCSALVSNGAIYAGDRLYFQRAMENKGFSVGNYQIGRISKKPTIVFGQALQNADQTVSGVVFAAVDLSWFEEFARDITLPRGSELAITDGNGVVLARYPREQIGGIAKEIQFPLEKIEYIEQGMGMFVMRGITGERRLVVAIPVGLEGDGGFLHLIINIPRASVTAAFLYLVTR